MRTWNPSTGEAEIGWCLGLMEQPASLLVNLQASEKHFFKKKKVGVEVGLE